MKVKKLHLRGTEFIAFSQNMRRMGLEEQMLFGAHITTIVACFLPWVSFDPLYGPSSYLTAFSGAIWLIGAFIFVLSLAAVVIFLDKLLEKHVIKLKVAESTILTGISLLSLILLICAWSVLRHVGQGYAGIEVRFGLALCLIAQITALVSLWLQEKNSNKSQTQEFFQLPTEKKSRQSHSTHPKK